ncbi:OmpH family outer membrane protein [Niveibacterium sp. SC-1]|uniref:OmpH family outer membrane protein n=1 Tax=Niveibacterium sp. SC-1 TaxID=3135646 RepID=UPI00311F9720
MLALAFGLLAAASAHAQSKIGFVSSERVLREAVPAVKAQKKLEKEFEKRDQDLQRMAKQLQSMQESLEKNGVTMGDADRKANEREYADLNREFQRRQREFREDLNQRRNEELAGVLERANKAIREIAETEKYDAILQDAIYINPRVDLTDRVIKALADK